MKIERDKWYLRRDGKREFVICVENPGDYSIVTHDIHGSVSRYCANGQLFGDKERPYDLVAPAPEPVRGYVVVTASNHALSPVCPNLEAAEDMAAMNPHSRILDLSTAKEVGDDQ